VYTLKIGIIKNNTWSPNLEVMIIATNNHNIKAYMRFEFMCVFATTAIIIE
jgi:hypothetical protein